MGDKSVQMIDMGDRQIATVSTPGREPESPGLFWLPGYKSDMSSTKASALADFARGRYAMTRFDYSGHGLSTGDFADGTIGRWLDEVEAVFAHACGADGTDAPTRRYVVIGSSMGGYLALLLLLRLLERGSPAAERIGAMVLVAPAWDMTEALMWAQFSSEQRASLMRDGYWLRPSDYGEPYRITAALIEEGRDHLLAGRPFDPGRPIHILQGLQDADVPAAHTRKLLELLPGGHVTLEMVPNGDHRLSRPQDIARLCEVVGASAERLMRS